MFDIVAACILASSSVGVWVCAISLFGDKLGLGLSRGRAAILAPLFFLLAFVSAWHFIREDLAGREAATNSAP